VVGIEADDVAHHLMDGHLSGGPALQRLLDTCPLPAALSETELAGRVLGMNRTLLQLLEYDAAELPSLEALLARSVSSATGADAAQRWWRSAGERGTPVEPFDMQVQRRDGSRCWLRVSATVSGARALLVFADVTALKETEAALRESEEKLRLAVAATRLGLWQWDIQSDVIEWDDTMLEIWGITRAQLPHARAAFMQSLHPEDAEKVTQAIQVGLATGYYPPIEHRLVRPDGSVRHVSGRAVITRAADGTPAKFIGSARDITEERELESRRQATQRLESIGQLSAGVAHNFNNLLMGIIPNLDLALSSAPPEMTQVLDAARAAALRAAELVGQLTTFAGRAPAASRRVTEARQLVERALATCRLTAERSMALVARYPEQSSFVSVDAVRLEQALREVLLNARDAVADPVVQAPALEISVDILDAGAHELSYLGLRDDRSYVRIRIGDNGSGMSGQVQSRIFEPFFTTKAPGRGTGLGLSTALAIVREHEGAIDCTSTPGVGSLLSLFLPMVAAEAPLVTPAPDTAARAAGREVILVVDDEAPVREVVRRLLNREGYVTHVAEGGAEALEALNDPELRRGVALVILDMAMPGMSGQQALRELRVLLPETPIVFLTGYAVDTPTEADGFIRKPVTAGKLAEAVREILSRRRPGALCN
jgi:PAS domain S-box-containing protein